MSKISEMNHEVLIELSKKKKNGSYTSDALKAQTKLYDDFLWISEEKQRYERNSGENCIDQD